MSEDPEPAVLNRHLIAIATAEYQYPPWDEKPLQAVAEELTTIRGWLGVDADPDRAAPRFSEKNPELADSPTLSQVQALVPDALRALRDSDAVVVYVTGHGHRDDFRRHWIVLSETEEHQPSWSALSTSTLVEWLGYTKVRYLLVLLDLCYAGTVVRHPPIVPDETRRDWIGLASADEHQPARVGALTQAIADYLEFLNRDVGAKHAGRAVRYLTADTFVKEIQKRLSDQNLTVLFPWTLGQTEHHCLPNPHYRPLSADAVEASRRDLAAHWNPRSRGVTDAADAGWLFSGRERLMEQIIAATDGPPMRYLVTGGVGTGKSAILARLVTLSDPGFLHEWHEKVSVLPPGQKPREGAVDVAVLATGLTSYGLLDRICAVLKVPRTAPTESDLKQLTADWHAWLAGRPKPVTVVVDALDEASNPSEMIRLLADLDLPRRRRIRLIVGVRSVRDDDAATPDGAAAKTLADDAANQLNADRIAVDEPPYWVDRDVVDYAERVLTVEASSPYARADAALTTRVAEEIAEGCGRSFLVTQLAAQYLATEQSVVDPANPAWHAVFERGVTGIFHRDLYRIEDDAERRRALDLLRALAYGRGRGLPWGDIWPAVANAVANLPDEAGYTDESIAWLLQHRIGGYLIADSADGTTVYRLFHDALRKSLREDFKLLLTEPP
jgi:hypothetical protein